MGKQWVREQVRHDEVQEAVYGTVTWVSRNRQTVGLVVGGIAVVLMAAGFFLYSKHSRENAAWDRLSLAQAQFYSGNADAAAKQAAETAAEFAGTDAGAYAQIFAGDVHFIRGRYQESVDEYAKALAAGSPASVLPLAQGGTVLAYEAAGKCQQAIGAAETFLQTDPEHFLAPQVHASLARCQLALNQTEQARSTLQKISLQYPETSWDAWAKSKLQPAKK